MTCTAILDGQGRRRRGKDGAFRSGEEIRVGDVE